jgi:polar amino acid transport system substrate-binding protein
MIKRLAVVAGLLTIAAVGAPLLQHATAGMGSPPPQVANPIAVAQAANPVAQADVDIVVATKPIAPFVLTGPDGLPRGYSIDLWDEIARRIDVTSRYEMFTKVTDVVDSVESGESDVGIAAISMTPAREEQIGFSHPYYNSGLQILVRNEATGAWGTVRAKLASPQIVYPVIGFLILIVLIAHAVWLFERKDNEDFPPKYFTGVWEGLFWSVVTVTTGGDAEKRLTKVGGRIVGMVWMLFGLFVVAYLTASVTSALTLAELRTGIESFSDLGGNDVITVEGTVADSYLTESSITHRAVATIEEAEAQVVNGSADALVFDAPVLQFFESTEGRKHVKVVGDVVKSDFYGIALHDDTYREQINRTLLELKSEGFLDDLYQKWFKP